MDLASDRQDLKAALRLTDARSQALLDASLDAIISMDHEGRIGEFNPAAERIFGYARNEVLGKPLADLIIPHRLREQHRQGLARYLREGAGRVVNNRIELSALRSSGEEFPVELAIVPVAGAEPPLFIGFLRDISERKEAEQRRGFLTNELAHRSKNLLTVIHALVARVPADKVSAQEARDILLKRVEALARSQDILVRGGLEGAPLGEIVRLEFEAFSERVNASGPPLSLTGRAAQTFALIVHELATNAVKYGALSVDAGCVSITWRVEGAGDAAQFKFRWEERDGPKVAEPTRKGFGRALLEQAAAKDLGAKAAVDFADQGLIYEIDAPLAAVEQRDEWSAP